MTLVIVTLRIRVIRPTYTYIIQRKSLQPFCEAQAMKLTLQVDFILNRCLRQAGLRSMLGGISGSSVHGREHEYCSQRVAPDRTGGSDVGTMVAGEAGGSSVRQHGSSKHQGQNLHASTEGGSHMCPL